MMPSGAPRPASQAGNRCSNGMIRALPTGDSPRMASTKRLATTSPRPVRLKRVASSSTPRSPIDTIRLDGMAKKPSTLDRTKNMDLPSWRRRLRLLPRLVARLGLLVHRIEAGQLHPALDLADDPGLHALVLGAFFRHEGDQALRDHHRPVVVANDDVAGK